MGDAINEFLCGNSCNCGLDNKKIGKTVKFHFYKGKSLISKLIKWRTYSIYSHVSIEINGEVYESWVGNGANGVVVSNSPLTYHEKGTKLTTIEINMKNVVLWKMFLDLQVGKKYDYLGLLGFVLDNGLNDHKRWFCSELADTFLNFEFKNYSNNRLVSPQEFYRSIYIISLLQKKYKEVLK